MQDKTAYINNKGEIVMPNSLEELLEQIAQAIRKGEGQVVAHPLIPEHRSNRQPQDATSIRYDDLAYGTLYWWNTHPYLYKIGKGQIPYLAAIDLDDVPSNSVALPHNIAVVRFEIENEPKYGLYLASIWNSWGLLLNCDALNFVWQYVIRADDVSIERHLEAINTKSDEPRLRGLSQEQYEMECNLCKDSLRAIVNVLMLSKCKPEFFKPDVLAKDRAAYADATRANDAERKLVIEERAKRRRKGPSFVFDTGTDWDIDLGHVGPAMPMSHGLGHERTHCWIRRGHWRRVRYGSGRAFAKWHFFPPQVCRPDLAKASTERVQFTSMERKDHGKETEERHAEGRGGQAACQGSSHHGQEAVESK
jgi:hypothetical protein